MACPITDNAQRAYPLNQPHDWQPKMPKWTLKLPEHIQELVVAYAGVQDHRHGGNGDLSSSGHVGNGSTRQDDITKAVNAIESWTQHDTTRPIIVDRLMVQSGRDVPGTHVWVCYWTSNSDAHSSLQRLDLEKIYRDAQCTSLGVWVEVITPDLTRFETNYAGDDYQPGLARLSGTVQESHDLTGYWGAARDRMRASAYDDFTGDTNGDSDHVGSNKIRTCETNSTTQSIVRGTNKNIIAHVRSGQFWQNSSEEEREAYEKDLEPHLLNGLNDIYKRAQDLGDYGLRFLRNIPTRLSEATSEPLRETCAAGFFQSLTDLENWAKDCPSHHKIFDGALHHKERFGSDARFRTWHEICVLKPGEATWEYIGCTEDTGTLKFQGGDFVKRLDI